MPRDLTTSIIVLSFFSFLAADTWAQNAPQPYDAYSAGLACFEQLDYNCAIELLNAAAQSDAYEQKQLIDIYRKLAESHLALGQRQEAISGFVSLLKIQPGYEITGAEVSPKIIAALEQARQSLAKAKPHPVEQTEAPSKPARMEFGVSAGAEFLFGEDKRLLKTGPVFELEGNFVLSGPWRVGLGLRYTFHDLAENDSRLHLGGVWASFGGAWQLKFVHLSALGGLGVAYFGVPQEEGKTSLVIPLRFSAGLSLGSGIQLGLVLEPGWLFSLDDTSKTSFTICMGVRLLAAF